MGTTGRFGGGGHGLTGPKHIWYDTDYSELYKGLAVVIGFFLFLVLLLLIFILISYLRKWYRLKKRPDNVSTAASSSVEPHSISTLKQLTNVEDAKFAKRFSKSGSTQQTPQQCATPPMRSSLAKMSLSSTPLEIVKDSGKHANISAGGGGNGCGGGGGVNQSAYAPHHHQHYQEFPPVPHYSESNTTIAVPSASVAVTAHHHVGGAASIHTNNMQPQQQQRSSRPSLATIALT